MITPETMVKVPWFSNAERSAEKSAVQYVSVIIRFEHIE